MKKSIRKKLKRMAELSDLMEIGHGSDDSDAERHRLAFEVHDYLATDVALMVEAGFLVHGHIPDNQLGIDWRTTAIDHETFVLISRASSEHALEAEESGDQNQIAWR